jgi:hypothetical protein
MSTSESYRGRTLDFDDSFGQVMPHIKRLRDIWYAALETAILLKYDHPIKKVVIPYTRGFWITL